MYAPWVFGLPAKLMSKCHLPATVIHNSYFLPSCLSIPQPAPFFPPSVCRLKASNEIHAKPDVRPDAFSVLAAFHCPSSSSYPFVFVSFSLALYFPLLIALLMCPSLFTPTQLLLLFFHYSTFQVPIFLLASLIPTLVFSLFIHHSYSLASHR